MPLIRISLNAGKPAAWRQAIGEGVHAAMIETLDGVPAADMFQIIAEHPAGTLVFDRHYFGMDRSDDIVFIEVTLRRGRTPEMKRAFYRRIVERLAENPGLRGDDVFVALRENELIDWSFGKGLSQLAPA